MIFIMIWLYLGFIAFIMEMNIVNKYDDDVKLGSRDVVLMFIGITLGGFITLMLQCSFYDQQRYINSRR